MTDEVKEPAGLSFGDALGELEGVVTALENGQLGLEESLAKYERGVALLRALQAKLAEAQQRVTVLIGELESETAEADTLAESSGAGALEE